jgi:general secretion pathway protein K
MRTVAAALDQRRAIDQPPLRALEELRNLAGMSGPLYQSLLEQVTVWSGLPSPDPAFATDVLQRALHLPDVRAQGADAGPIVGIRSQADLPDGMTSVIDSTVLLLPMDTGARPFRVVRYNE